MPVKPSKIVKNYLSRFSEDKESATGLELEKEWPGSRLPGHRSPLQNPLKKSPGEEFAKPGELVKVLEHGKWVVRPYQK